MWIENVKFLLILTTIGATARKIAKNKFYKLSVTKYPALYLTATENADWDNQSPADVDMKEWMNLPEQRWKIHTMGHHKYYLSSLENDYNKLSLNVKNGQTSIKYLRFKNLDGGDSWNIMDMQGLCMQFKRDHKLRNFINVFTGDETGLVWRKCIDAASQKWTLKAS